MTRKKTTESNGLLSLLAIFLITFNIYADFGIRKSYGYLVILAIAVFLAISHIVITPFNRYCGWYWLFISPCAIYSLLPISYFSENTLALTIYMLISGFFILCARTSINEATKILHWIQAFSFLISVYIIFVKLFPSIYESAIAKIITPYSREAARSLMRQGYGVPIGDSITYADYMIAISLLCILTKGLFSPKEIKINFLFFAKIAIYVLAVFIENRKSEIFALTVVLLFVFMLSLNPHRVKENIKKVSGLLMIIIAGLVSIYFLYKSGSLGRYEGVINKILLRSSYTQDVTGGRFDLWGKAINLFKEKPVFGIGWEQFLNNNRYRHDVHNTYLQWLCETGLTGFLLIFIPYIKLFYMSFKTTRKVISDNNRDNNLLTASVVGTGMQLFFLIINIVDSAFYHLNFFCFFGLVAILSETSERAYYLQNTSARSDLF